MESLVIYNIPEALWWQKSNLILSVNALLFE